MKKTTILLIFIALLNGACAKQESKNSSKNHPLVLKFHTCRKLGNKTCMEKAFQKIVEKNLITKGMEAKKVISILGTFQHVTGIYLPGGYSYGYGNKKGTTENYPDFFWIHFRAIDWNGKNEGKPVLLRWD